LKAHTPEGAPVASAVRKLEFVPIGSFRRSNARARAQGPFIVFTIDTRIAFARCLREGEDYDLYTGLDYHFNDETDLNFNQAPPHWARALQKRPAKIYFGQATDAFRVRSCE